MLTIIPLILIVIGIGTLLVLVARHASQVAALDVSEMPEERDAILKSTILENRLLRKTDTIVKGVNHMVGPIQKALRSWYGSSMKRVRSLERSYRFQSGLPDSSKKADIKVRDKLTEAQEAVVENKLSLAESCYLNVIKMDPQSFDAYMGLGMVYEKMEEWDQARETYGYITKHWPQSDQGFAQLAFVEEQTGNLEDAKDHFLHALSINNKVALHHFGLAELYMRLNEKEKALSSLQKAQALEPNNPKVLDQLFVVSVVLKNVELAEEALTKIKKVNPDHGNLSDFEKKLKELKK